MTRPFAPEKQRRTRGPMHCRKDSGMSMNMSREKKINLMTPEGPAVIRYMQGKHKTMEELTCELNHKPHLSSCEALFEAGSSNKVILVCDTIRLGLDACHTVVDLLTSTGNVKEADPLDTDEEELDQFFKDLDIELDTELDSYSAAGEAMTRGTERETDEGDPLERLCKDCSCYVIYSEKEIDNGACDDLGETMDKAMMMQKKKAGLIPQAAASLIVQCDGITALSDETVEFMLDQSEKAIIVLVPKQKVNHQKIDRLMFEGGFETIQVQAPSEEYLEEEFLQLMSREGWAVGSSVDVKAAIRRLKKERGTKFGERDMILLSKASQKKHQKLGRPGTLLTEIAAPHYTAGLTSGKQLLDHIVGLDDVKSIIEMEINRQAYRSRLMEEMNRSGEVMEEYTPCRNMAFCGNPGTCKTTMARAMAVRMGELGVTNGTFLEVSREHLVGRYMGETSLKVAGIFEKARGGVLFIDEAGSLAGDGQDHYSEEAVSAIVRHMENERETVVIFATYNGDMEKLMATDEGLRSRIGRMIHFADYTPEQLTDIFCSMAASRGYHVEEGAGTLLIDYFRKASERKDFGAGREARRLLDQTEGQMANLAMTRGYSGSQLRLLTCDIIEESAGTLLGESKEKRRTIGFAPRPTV